MIFQLSKTLHKEGVVNEKQLIRLRLILKVKIVSPGLNPPGFFNETLKNVKFYRGSASLRA